MRRGRFPLGRPGMDVGWGRALAALGALVLGFLLIFPGALVVAHGGGWGWIISGAAGFCWTAALLLGRRR
jgi:hypothetical protein